VIAFDRHDFSRVADGAQDDNAFLCDGLVERSAPQRDAATIQNHAGPTKNAGRMLAAQIWE
jgi:hypothetical protein